MEPYTPDQQREGNKRILRAIYEEDIRKYKKSRLLFIVMFLISFITLSITWGFLLALNVFVMFVAFGCIDHITGRISILRQRFNQQPTANSQKHD